MEKFTKGEWFSKDGDGFSKEVIITTDDREDCFIIPICEMDMFFDGDVGVEQAANAALIAAAPEMYNMLKKLQLEGGLGIARHREIDRVMEKARGEK